MKIQIGFVCLDKVTQQRITLPNKTRKYLIPCLKEYGEEFVDMLNSVFKVAAGIGDIVVSNRRGKIYEKHIFILIDSSVSPGGQFENFISWIQEQPMYEDDYVYGNIAKSDYHMVVLKFPEKYYGSFETFLKGEYSKMYDTKSIDKFFKNYPRERRVFIKDHNYRIEFTHRLNRVFGTNISPEEYSGELDFSPNDESDKFNHHLKQ